MKTAKFKSIVKKVKSRGTCFIRVPEDFAGTFLDKEEIMVKIDDKINFFGNIRFFRGIGFYVPADIAIKNNLFNKTVDVSLEKIDGFYAKISYEGRVYIPNDLAKVKKLSEDNLVLLECKTENKIIREYCKVHIRKKENTIECFCMFTKKRSQKTYGLFRIIKIFPHKKLENTNYGLKKIMAFENFAEISKNNIIIFHGNRVPIIINTNIKLEELAYYMGCYFADGTKKGNSWGICASTFEQAKYYHKMHKKLIDDSKIVNSISYSDPKDTASELLKNQLRKLWQNETDIILNGVSVNIYRSKDKNAPNRNKYGTLLIKENRELTRIYYVRLLNFLFNKIKKEDNKELALDFILGALEGDGSVGADRGSLMITSNLKELEILGYILKYTQFSFRKQKEGENKGYIFIGSLQIIKNISLLKDRLFKYYPKRRKILKERLAQTGCARYLLGKSKKTSNWLIWQLNNYGILDGKGNLTELGKKIQKDLKEFLLSND